MTADDVRRRVAMIDAESADPEAAHSDEDALWFDVLTAIAEGAKRPSVLAAEAIKTRAIEFARWCA